MKKVLITIIGAALGLTLCASDQAADQKKPEMTPEQQQKVLIEKYDLNKDGKLDKDELAKMSQEDKAKWESLQSKKQEQEKSQEKSGKKE